MSSNTETPHWASLIAEVAERCGETFAVWVAVWARDNDASIEEATDCLNAFTEDVAERSKDGTLDPDIPCLVDDFSAFMSAKLKELRAWDAAIDGLREGAT